jgi:hypothetical protein
MGSALAAGRRTSVTPERAAGLVLWWARVYTARLPPALARRRIDELAADLEDHLTAARLDGADEARLARAVLSRSARGLPADVAWRHHVISSRRKNRPMSPARPVVHAVARVALGVLLVLTVPFILTVTSDGNGWHWHVGDFLLAAVALGLIGACLELAIRRAGHPLIAVATAAVGGAAGVLGQVDDAPGLVLLGVLLVAAAGGIVARPMTRRHG